MPLKSYKICPKIFEHGFDPPPPFWTMFKKTADLVYEGTPYGGEDDVAGYPSDLMEGSGQRDNLQLRLIPSEVVDDAQQVARGGISSHIFKHRRCFEN